MEAAIGCCKLSIIFSRCWYDSWIFYAGVEPMIRKLKSGGYRLYSRKINPRTGRRRNLGTFRTLSAAKQHEREIQYFKRA